MYCTCHGLTSGQCCPMRDKIIVTKFLSCIIPFMPCSLRAVGIKESTNLPEKVTYTRQQTCSYQEAEVTALPRPRPTCCCSDDGVG